MNYTRDSEVVAYLSNTQRISLIKKPSSVVLVKEYRKRSEDEWILSKGIEIKNTLIPDLVSKLSENQKVEVARWKTKRENQ